MTDQTEALPVGACVAAALAAARIPCDSGEDVDRFLSELQKFGYVVASFEVFVRGSGAQAEAEAALAESRALATPSAERLDKDGYTLRDRAIHVVAAWETDRHMLDSAIHHLHEAIVVVPAHRGPLVRTGQRHRDFPAEDHSDG